MRNMKYPLIIEIARNFTPKSPFILANFLAILAALALKRLFWFLLAKSSSFHKKSDLLQYLLIYFHNSLKSYSCEKSDSLSQSTLKS